MLNYYMQKQAISFELNGKKETVDNVSATTTVLEYLRSSGKTGTKEGCGDGDCGACTIALINEDIDGNKSYQAMNSCLMPIAAIDGKQVFTVEGIANKTLHPVQQAMVDSGGSQCGYCTPGFIMSMFAGHYSDQLSDESIEGNLCRCTGYVAIRKAAKTITKAKSNDKFAKKLKTKPKANKSIELALKGHRYFSPISLNDVFIYQAKYKNAVLIAGATDLGLDLSNKRRDFPVLISLENVAELKQINESSESLEIGAAISLSQIEHKLAGRFDVLDTMLKFFAARQIKNRATIGGNIGTASPIGDLLPVFLALDAAVNLQNANQKRAVLLAEYFTGYRQTKKEADEVIISVTIPKKEAGLKRLSHSYKIAKRGTDDISIVAASFVIDLNKENKITHARLAYGGVAAIPIRAIAAEKYLLNKSWSKKTILKAKEILLNEFTPLDDLRASASYRNSIVANLFEKFFVEVKL